MGKQEQTNSEYLTKQLVEGRKLLNKSCSQPNFSYDPDVISLHNEYFVNNNGPTLDKVRAEYSEEALLMIKKQEAKIRFESLNDKMKQRIKNILRPH